VACIGISPGLKDFFYSRFGLLYQVWNYIFNFTKKERNMQYLFALLDTNIYNAPNKTGTERF